MSALTITILQLDLKWQDKASNLAMIGEELDRLQGRTEVVILPEMFSTGFSMVPGKLAETMEGETVNWMKSQAARHKVILAGSVIIGENGDYHNRLIWMLPNGQYGYYDKRHLFAFGGEDEYYTPGTRRLIASVKGWKVNLQVCYDLRFPVWARNRIVPAAHGTTQEGSTTISEEYGLEYDLLIYVANWPEKRIKAWKALLAARAIENQCFVVGVNRVGLDGNGLAYSGDSMVVDPFGEVLHRLTVDERVHTFTLRKEPLEEAREKYPFWKDGDEFTLR